MSLLNHDMIAHVYIELKKGVADPEGENTKKALQLLGFDGVRDVRTIKVFRIELDELDEDQGKRKVEEMCEKLLANPVIHNYRIEIG